MKTESGKTLNVTSLMTILFPPKMLFLWLGVEIVKIMILETKNVYFIQKRLTNIRAVLDLRCMQTIIAVMGKGKKMRVLNFIFKTIGISFCLMMLGTVILGRANHLIIYGGWICGFIIGLLTERKNDNG
jgi:hypothetical protein